MLLVLLGTGHEGKWVLDGFVQWFSYCSFLRFLHFSILYYLSLFNPPSFIFRHQGCVTLVILHLTYNTVHYKPPSEGVCCRRAVKLKHIFQRRFATLVYSGLCNSSQHLLHCDSFLGAKHLQQVNGMAAQPAALPEQPPSLSPSR